MTSTVEHVFTSTAAGYDRNRARLIPCFDRLYGSAVGLLPDDATSILDLGAGTGLLSAMLRARFPRAKLHLVDLSGAMLEEARRRFDGDTGVSFEVADYSVAALGGSFDAVASALSIHHLEHRRKRALFGRIAQALRPGGVFINAEQVLGPTPALEERYRSDWLRQVKALGATETEIAASLFRQREDRCAPVEDQLLWMRAAGFADADCWFKDGRFATLAGTRPASE